MLFVTRQHTAYSYDMTDQIGGTEIDGTKTENGTETEIEEIIGTEIEIGGIEIEVEVETNIDTGL